MYYSGITSRVINYISRSHQAFSKIYKIGYARAAEHRESNIQTNFHNFQIA